MPSGGEKPPDLVSHRDRTQAAHAQRRPGHHTDPAEHAAAKRLAYGGAVDAREVRAPEADAQPLRRELSGEQEAAVVADRKLLLLAICALSQWSFEQIVQTYHPIFLSYPDAKAVSPRFGLG